MKITKQDVIHSTEESLQTIGVMDWAHCLAEFEAPEIDSAWID